MNKILTGVIAASMVLSFVAPVAAGAQSMTTTTTTASYTFSTSLTIGSTGADVVALQSWLVAKGYLVMPAGVSMGYFGNLTKNAVAAYQSAKGISPAAGYFGPITRAAVNADQGSSTTTTTTTGSCPAGYTCTSTTPVTTVTCPAGYTCTSNTGTTVTTNSTQEGTLTVTLAAQPASSANIRTQTNVPVYGLQFMANIAPVTVQTIDLQVGDVNGSSGTENPSSFVNTITVSDQTTGNVLETIPVTSTTFTKDQNQVYYVQIPGLNFVVPLGTTKTLAIAFSTNSIDSSRTLTLQGYGASSIRAVSGQNISEFYNFSGSGYTLTQTFQKPGQSTLMLNASGSPLRSQNYYIDPTNGAQSVPVVLFTLNSTTGDSQVQTVYASTTASGTQATTLYLYNGSTLLSSKSVPAGTGPQSVVFNNLTSVVPQNTIANFSIKEDFPSGSTSGSYGSTTVNNVVYQTPNGNNNTVSTAVSGVNQYFYNAAPQFVIAGTPTTATVSNQTGSTTSMTAQFTFNVTALGSNMTQPVGTDFVVDYATNTTNLYTAPSVSVTTFPNNNIGQGATAQVTVTASVPTGSVTYSGLYTFFIASIHWTVGTSTATQTYGLDDFKVPTAVNFVK